MPLSTEKRLDLESRRACVAQLYGLGMSQAQVSEVLEVPPGTVKNDIAFLKLPAREKRSATGRFAQLFKLFSVFSTTFSIPDQRKIVVESHPGPYALVQLSIFLEMALGLPSVWTRLEEAEALFKKVMSTGAHEPPWCCTLLEAVFGARRLVHDLRDVRLQYVEDVAQGRIDVPESTDAVYEAMFARLAEAARESMRPSWPEPERVEHIVFGAMNTLDAQESEVLNSRFREGKSRDALVDGVGVNGERIRQIEAQALRKLRHPSRKTVLQPLWDPVSLSWDATVGAQKRFDTIYQGLIDLLASPAVLTSVAERSDGDRSATRQPRSAAVGVDDDIVDALCKTVDELQLGVRAANCLQNVNIKYIWELVVKTEADLLRTTGFGPSSLMDVKRELAALSAGRTRLTLGMSPSDPDIVAARSRCPRE